MSVSENLRAAADLLDKHPWGTGTPYDVYTCKICALGAVAGVKVGVPTVQIQEGRSDEEWGFAVRDDEYRRHFNAAWDENAPELPYIARAVLEAEDAVAKDLLPSLTTVGYDNLTLAWGYNDAKGRTKEEVQAVLRRAAQLAEEDAA